MTSYFSERTAEYSILPPVVGYFARRFGCAAPIYFWATREGNTVASDQHTGVRLRVLAVFARRPKIGAGKLIYGKLNRELFEFAHRAKAFGIPTVAGFPAVRTVFELNGDFRTYWFALDGEGTRDIHFQIDQGLPADAPRDERGRAMRTLELDDLGDALECAAVLDWNEAMRAIRSSRHTPRMIGGAGFFWGGSTYTPAYILVPDAVAPVR